METLWQDLRYGARLQRLNPGFTAVAVLSLALGIGANTAIFQLLDAVRLRTLPVKNPQELAVVRIADRKWSSGRHEGRYSHITNPMWEQIREHQEGFSSIFANRQILQRQAAGCGRSGDGWEISSPARIAGSRVGWPLLDSLRDSIHPETPYCLAGAERDVDFVRDRGEIGARGRDEVVCGGR